MTDAPDKPIYDAVRALKAQYYRDPNAELSVEDMAVLLPAVKLATDQILNAANVPSAATAPAPAAAPATAPTAASPIPNFDTIKAHLGVEEGRVPYAYQDSMGYWTIGVGRLIDHRKGGHLSDEEIDHLLANDIQSCINGLQSWPAWAAVKGDPVRSAALISMAFQLGLSGLSTFTTALGLIASQQWQAAADDLMTTLWARQTPNRARTETQMLATGQMP